MTCTRTFLVKFADQEFICSVFLEVGVSVELHTIEIVFPFGFDRTVRRDITKLIEASEELLSRFETLCIEQIESERE